MTFLELCRRLRQECGGSGTGPASVTAATGQDRLWVDWTNQAWLELQEMRPNWWWLWREAQIPIIASISTYTIPSPTVQADSFRIGGQRLHSMTWKDYQRRHGGKPLQDTAPTGFAVRPDMQLQLNARPIEDATLHYEHYLRPSEMTENTEVPTLPARYQMLIVYAAMLKYAMYENAPEVMQAADFNYRRMLARLNRDGLPAMEMAGPLA